MKKYKLCEGMGKCPQNLTEARKFISQSSLNRLSIGQSIEFKGIGNFYNFSITRIR